MCFHPLQKPQCRQCVWVAERRPTPLPALAVLTRSWRPDANWCVCPLQEGSGDPAEDEWSERRRRQVTALVGGIKGERGVRVCVSSRSAEGG